MNLETFRYYSLYLNQHLQILQILILIFMQTSALKKIAGNPGTIAERFRTSILEPSEWKVLSSNPGEGISLYRCFSWEGDGELSGSSIASFTRMAISYPITVNYAKVLFSQTKDGQNRVKCLFGWLLKNEIDVIMTSNILEWMFPLSAFLWPILTVTTV